MKVKYPRTPHLPWSSGTKDDRVLKDTKCFEGKKVICTLKMDGENTTIGPDYIHARSLDSGYHESRSWVKQLQGKIGYLLDENMRVCGENLYARHTVEYDDLESFFYGFSFWIDNKCLAWEETVALFNLLGISRVPTFYTGKYDKDKIEAAFKPYEEKHEGYVIRLEDEFNYEDFQSSVAKYVKPVFKQAVDASNVHWAQAKVVPNKLKSKNGIIT